MMNTAAAARIHTINTINITGGISDDRNRNIIRERKILRSKEIRESEIKKHTFQLVFAIFFIFTVLFGMNHFISRAGAAKETELSFKYYRNIPVEEGDTLESIAQIYADEEHYESTDAYLREVRLMNHLEEEDKIYAGGYLIIPYFSNELK